MKLQTKLRLGLIALLALLAAPIAAIGCNYLGKRASGEVVILSLGVILGSAAGVLLISRSVLQEMQCRQHDLEALNNELWATNRNYMEMLGFVAHELKNPLASAVISLYTVKDGYLGEITPATEEKPGVGSPQPRRFPGHDPQLPGPVPLGEGGTCRSQDLLSPANPRGPAGAGRAGGRTAKAADGVENRIPEGRVVYADASLLKIVYCNLLSNAVKYGRKRGQSCSRSQDGDGTLMLSVRNDSAGIPQDQIPLLFRKFSRLYNPEYEGKRGTGLGLYICRDIVEKHGGTIWVDSQMGQWVQFSFTLPKQERGTNVREVDR